MSEEHKPVMCRCGEEMHFVTIEREASCGEAPWFGYYTCDCGWMAPSREGDTPEDCERNAYAAATRRPPNRPLDYKTIYNMTDREPVWRVDKDDDVIVLGGYNAWRKYDAVRYLYFSANPSPADIEAARKGLDCK